MNETAIIVDGLGKQYRLGDARKAGRSLKEVLTQAAAAPFRGRKASGSGAFWALKDVSFQVKQGEVLGIVGSNGAGKSTLLKILSRITDPTVGHAEIRGRLGSLLEVGTGFHPELTGRENVYLNGAILGMKRREIDDSFDKIVDFAAVERFIDTPVKHFSSGMYVRLAFAVAAHLEPEILIVDEVLAVGDMAFQARCIQHFQNMCERGKTVLLISHNMAVVKQICGRALLLDGGALIGDGHPGEMIERYTSLQRGNGKHLQAQRKLQHEDPVRWGTGAVTITRVYTSTAGNETHVFGRGEQIELVLEFETLESPGDAVVGFAINNSAGLPVFSSNSSEMGMDMPTLETGAQYRATFRIENVFGDDTYSVSCAVNNPDRTRPYARLENVHLFEVDGNSKRSPVWPRHHLSLVRIDE